MSDPIKPFEILTRLDKLETDDLYCYRIVGSLADRLAAVERRLQEIAPQVREVSASQQAIYNIHVPDLEDKLAAYIKLQHELLNDYGIKPENMPQLEKL